MRNKNFCLIIIPMAEWKVFWLREFLEILSQDLGVKVVFIQPSRFQIPFVLSRGQSRPFLIERKNQNLYIYHPFHPFPFGRFKIIHYINSFSLSLQIRYLVRRLKLESPFLFTTYPLWSMYLMGKCGEKGRIFYYADEYAEYPGGSENWKRFVYRLTEIHISNSDIVLAVNFHLKEKAKKLNQKVFLLPNAASENVLSFYPTTNEEKSTVIGYMGRINDRIDFELVEFIVKRYPQYKVEFLGGIEAGATSYTYNWIERLKKYSNIFFLPPVSSEKVAEHIKRWKVAIIPFIINPLTQGISPLKLYEYCAIGLPVVTVDIPGVYPLKEIIYIAKNPDDFVEKIKIAIEENDKNKGIRKELIQKKHTWKKRCEEFIKIVEEH